MLTQIKIMLVVKPNCYTVLFGGFFPPLGCDAALLSCDATLIVWCHVQVHMALISLKIHQGFTFI